MNWRWWRRRPGSTEAERAERAAYKKLDEARARIPENRRAARSFVDEVERALRGTQ